MKKITLVSAVAAAAFATTAAFSATSVFADDTTPNPTTAHIKLTVDGTQGLNGITLTQAPSIEFGTQALEPDGHTYTSSEVKGALQVTNPGVDQGWTVQVASSAFKAGNNTLKGAVLTLNAGTVSNGEENQSALATPKAVTLDGTETKTTGDSTDTKNDGVDALTAGDGTVCVGVTTESFAATAASLKVPAGNVAGDYSANLTWTLNNTLSTK